MTSSDYRFTLLGTGEFALYRRRGADGSVLIAIPAGSTALEAQLETLRHEYALRSDLHPDWACVPVEFTHFNDSAALVLRDPGGVLLRAFCSAPQALNDFLPIAISIASTLSRVHAKGLIHTRMNPDNVLVRVPSGRAWLTGFGRAHRIAAVQSAEGVSSDLCLTSLNYMAPEQSGRMNRPVDVRSDLYAIGCIFYELLTANRLFDTQDAEALLHSHVAKQPPSPAERVAGVPPQLTAIVMKLLAKAPDERYQSAAGLVMDLSRCLAALETEGAIDAFPLDSRHVSYSLKLSNRLYGRELEVAAVVAGFNRVAETGTPELLLISGESGSGKSSLVREVFNQLRCRPHFSASGKFDEVKRATPYAGLAQALQALVHPILGYEDAEYARWRTILQAALGTHVRLMSGLVPELALIMGEQPPISHLPPQAEKERFLRLATRLIGAFGAEGRPLVLFLDDLQWIDAGTLAVVEYLVTDQTVRNILLIGAYRTGEVDGDHPLRKGFAEARAVERTLALRPLREADIGHLVSDVLGCARDVAMPLAALIHEKTRGDPFFAIQFITALHDEDLIYFDDEAFTWEWDIPRITAKGYSDNVVDLVLQKFDLLSASAKVLLQFLTCLGSGAATRTLSVAAAVSPEVVHTTLAEACTANLVYERDDGYAFWHDRIQEAAYAIVPMDERESLHLEIGRRLLSNVCPEEEAESLFETANQINRGSALVTSLAERERFGRLNLLAGQRAKAATAYASALEYLSVAARLMEGTVGDCETVHAIALHRAECEYLTGALDVAERRFAELSQCKLDLSLRAELTRLRAALYTTLDRPDVALEVGLDYLRMVGLEMPLHPADAEVEREHARILGLLNGRDINELRELPLMRELRWRGTMDVLADLVPAALFTDANLHDLMRLRMTSLSLEHGHCDASCYGYASPIFGFRFGDYDSAFKFGELARFLITEKGLARFRARAEMSYGALVLPWKKPVGEGQIFMRQALSVAAESGDVTFEVYCKRNLLSNLIFAGTSIEEMQREAELGMAFAREKHFGLVVDAHLAQIVMFRRLRGMPVDVASLLAAGYDREWIARFARGESSHRAIAAFSYWTHSLTTSLLFGDVQGAIAAEGEALKFYASSRGFLETAEYHFYGALARAAALRPSENGWLADVHRKALDGHLRQLSIWKDNCEANFACRVYLVDAEIARAESRFLDAEHLYERAMQTAKAQQFLHVEALATELAADFYSERTLHTIAHMYARNARYAYLCWGADAKIVDIDRRYPGIMGPLSPLALESKQLSGGANFDVVAVVKASHALSSEIVFESLLKTLLGIAIEHAGARYGVLALLRAGQLQIAARASSGPSAIAFDLQPAVVDSTTLPKSLILTVMRTQTSIVLDDACSAGSFQQDEYVLSHAPRSVLCLPLLKQGQLVGLLYMENNLAPGVFTPERSAVLDVLSSQAAISLENARLYAELVEENRQRTEVESALKVSRLELARVTRLTTMGQLVASIVHEVSQPITAVNTWANAGVRWLNRDKPDVVEARTIFQKIVTDCTRAADVIRGLRALAKKAAPERVVFDLNQAIGEVLALARTELHRASIQLDRTSVQGTLLVNGDRVQLQQVMLNLLMNAIEAMSPVDREVRKIVVGSELTDAQEAVVTVQDNGEGLSPEAITRIFDPFVTTKTSGMGMGLSICRTIVESHGGDLTVTSTQGQGATFRVRLPVGGSSAEICRDAAGNVI